MPQGLICVVNLFNNCMEAVLANCTQMLLPRDNVLGGGPTRESMLREYTKVLASNMGLPQDGLSEFVAKSILNH